VNTRQTKVKQSASLEWKKLKKANSKKSCHTYQTVENHRKKTEIKKNKASVVEKKDVSEDLLEDAGAYAMEASARSKAVDNDGAASDDGDSMSEEGKDSDADDAEPAPQPSKSVKPTSGPETPQRQGGYKDRHVSPTDFFHDEGCARGHEAGGRIRR